MEKIKKYLKPGNYARFIRNKLIFYVNKLQKKFKMGLSEGGERIYISYLNFDIGKLDSYQRAHYERYIFAKEYLKDSDSVADMACGTGYGSLILSEKAKTVDGFDMNNRIIKKISVKYRNFSNVKFINHDLLEPIDGRLFDKIISFETIEHIPVERINALFLNFNRSLKAGGDLIFSAPYMQKSSKVSLEMGFHKTFFINEEMILSWLAESGFLLEDTFYQNYDGFKIEKSPIKKDFIICIARKAR